MKIRIYGKELNRWTGMVEKNGRQVEIMTQVELEYREYDVETGALVGAGSEDFSRERYNNTLAKPGVYTWDGERRNKGGYRWFDYRGYITVANSDRKLAKQYMMKKYNATEVELRK